MQCEWHRTRLLNNLFNLFFGAGSADDVVGMQQLDFDEQWTLMRPRYELNQLCTESDMHFIWRLTEKVLSLFLLFRRPAEFVQFFCGASWFKINSNVIFHLLFASTHDWTLISPIDHDAFGIDVAVHIFFASHSSSICSVSMTVTLSNQLFIPPHRTYREDRKIPRIHCHVTDWGR